MPPLLADFSHARACKPFCEKYLTLPRYTDAVDELIIKLSKAKKKKVRIV